MQHPELIELQALAAGILDPSRQRAVDEHLGGCSECAKTYVEVFLGRSGGGPKGMTGQVAAATAPAATPARPATPIASPPARGTPQPAFAVEPVPAAPFQVAATARPGSPSPTRVETVVTLRSGEQPTVELHEVADAAPLADHRHAPPAATAAQGSDAIAEALQQQPTLTEAITRLRSSGMSHIARALTPQFVQAAVPAVGASPAARPAGPNKAMLAIAAGAALLLGGGAIAYRGMVNAARDAAVAATRAPATPATPAASAPAPAQPPSATPAPVAGASGATPVAAAPGAAATSGATGAPATTTTSGGTVAAVPAAPAREAGREAAPRESAPREAKPTRREDAAQKVAEKPGRRDAAPALPSVALPDVSGAVNDDAAIDRLSGRSASRAAATDLQRSAGWATSRTTAKP